ncbi:hypothetical protein SK854_09750 [Lentzea sp. BCCO 10_0061]|uniref:Uncharacterized protein n=1 Tax=Lentzea sokolovensis TaxID=3095429 RepID=A0ABU4UTC7_9PSEU|nr:hypothetical protein [Lentzea sp. BCCO 10_0061]MDX8142397.1 hypothetical protein [Lentzea sp. BCCO 10_0061]
MDTASQLRQYRLITMPDHAASGTRAGPEAACDTSSNIRLGDPPSPWHQALPAGGAEAARNASVDLGNPRLALGVCGICER